MPQSIGTHLPSALRSSPNAHSLTATSSSTQASPAALSLYPGSHTMGLAVSFTHIPASSCSPAGQTSAALVSSTHMYRSVSQCLPVPQLVSQTHSPLASRIFPGKQSVFVTSSILVVGLVQPSVMLYVQPGLAAWVAAIDVHVFVSGSNHSPVCWPVTVTVSSVPPVVVSMPESSSNTHIPVSGSACQPVPHPSSVVLPVVVSAPESIGANSPVTSSYRKSG